MGATTAVTSGSIAPVLKNGDGVIAGSCGLGHQRLPHCRPFDGNRLADPPDVSDGPPALDSSYVDGLSAVSDREIRRLLGDLGQALESGLGRRGEASVRTGMERSQGNTYEGRPDRVPTQVVPDQIAAVRQHPKVAQSGADRYSRLAGRLGETDRSTGDDGVQQAEHSLCRARHMERRPGLDPGLNAG